MRLIVVVLVSVIFTFGSYPAFAVSPAKADRLFCIERSKNKNLVQYDIHLTEKRELPESNPVSVYWVLENGCREELTPIQRFAYGIASQVKLAKDKLKVGLVALKSRDVIVQKLNGSFKALVSINGTQSILEKVYIKAEEKSVGFPKVLYVDLIGKSIQTNLPVRERITPGQQQQASM